MREGWFIIIGAFLILLGVITSIESPDSRPPDPMAPAAAAGSGSERASGNETAAAASDGLSSTRPRTPDSGGSRPAGDESENAEQATAAGVSAFQGPLVAPSFDIVRIERNGAAVVTGRAAPGSTVTVLLDSRPLATAVAGPRGEWTVLAGPLEPGPHDLRVKAAGPDGEEIVSGELVSLGLSQKADDEPLVVINHAPAGRKTGGIAGTATRPRKESP